MKDNRLFVLCLIVASFPSAFLMNGCKAKANHSTWYVRQDGGTRYTVNKTDGQCSGLVDAPYSGSGVNQPCAFRDIRYLWADGKYATGPSFPAWGWIGAGGDTYIIDCPQDCRVGYSGPNSGDYFLALAGNPYGSGAPAPPSGTPEAHTRILGRNWENCMSDDMKAHVNGGYGVYPIFQLRGASYIDFACFNITDHSECGRAGQALGCHTSYPMDDYATGALSLNNSTNHVAITDVRIHGMANVGMIGSTGDGVSLLRVALIGNPSSGWNMDAGDGQTGTGNLTLQHVDVEWNGCAEEYPIIDALPYKDCTDQNSSGYGDGIGTASAHSEPAWHINVSDSIAAYNAQDGFDFLHLGAGSSLTISGSLMFSNMGQQLKVGTASTSYNNLIIGNCQAMRQAIPGTPAGYNSRLSNYCRAGDSAVAIAVSDTAQTIFQHNTMMCANATCIEVSCAVSTCTAAATLQYQDNAFIGFKNSTENGYPASPAPTNDYSNPIYLASNLSGLFSHAGSAFDHNATWHSKSNWTCPKSSWGESAAVCSDPVLVDEKWPLYGHGDMHLAAGSPLIGHGVKIESIATDYDGKSRVDPPAISAYEGPAGSPPAGQLTVTAGKLTCPATVVAGTEFSCTVTLTVGGSKARR